MSDTLEIRLLGKVSFKRGGTTLGKPSSQKAKALFLFVAHHQEPVSRDTLAGLLYPELFTAKGPDQHPGIDQPLRAFA